jgi:hypothetical protein
LVMAFLHLSALRKCESIWSPLNRTCDSRLNKRQQFLRRRRKRGEHLPGRCASV